MAYVRRIGIGLGALAFFGTLPGCHLALGDFEEVPDSTVAQCTVTRDECTTHGSAGCTPKTTQFTASTCSATGDASPLATCQRAFCSANDDYAFVRSSCKVTSAVSGPPAAGICRTTSGQTHQARIHYRQRYRTCTTGSDATACATLTDPLTLNPPDPANDLNTCFDTTEYPAASELLPSVTIPAGLGQKAVTDATVEILSIGLDDQSCPLTADNLAKSSNELNFAVPGGQAGTVVAGAFSTSLTATQGFASIGSVCGAESCSPQLDRFDLTFADVSVPGATLTGLSAHIIAPAPIVPWSGHQQVPGGFLKLALRGKVNGVRSVLRVDNVAPWIVDFTDQSVHVEGPVTVVAADANGKELVVQTTVSVTAPRATAAQVSCATASPLERLFGFEERESWSSSEAQLSLVSSPVRQGCGALGVAGQGYMSIASKPFSTAGLAVQNALSVELFVPGNQPNPSYLGALQLYLTCPSGGVTNQYVGQALLTGLPQNQFSTLRIPLPFATSQALRRNLADCSFTFGLNANPTGRLWELDNLRFTP